MKVLMRRIMRCVRRVGEEIYCRKRYIVYSTDLKLAAGLSSTTSMPIEFRINAPEAVAVLKSGGMEYECDESMVGVIDRQLTEGEVCVSGWVGGEMAYYGWIQFRQRQLARRTTLPIPAGTAFIYRCFTRADFRGKHIYPMGLIFTCRWLAAQGYQWALIDHRAGNSASQAGILRAGMRPVAAYTVVQILDHKWAVPDQALHRLTSNA